MRNKLIRIILTVLQIFPFLAFNSNAGEPCSHIMICCKACNRGVSFLVNGEWNASHDYGDINQVRDIMQNIKDAGINTVIIDMTNPSQWTYLYNIFEPMVDNIKQVCIEKDMQFFMLIGAQLPDATKVECGIPPETDAFEFWNGIAERIWNNWAQDQTYRKYGFGDDRPMIIAFLPSEWYWRDYNTRPAEYKTYLSKYYIGTTQVNDPITVGETDGWGYRKSIGNPSGTIRYTSPNGGIGPDTWHKISPEAFRAEVQWASEAEHYSIYGSYDDACDAIFWGIADTKNSLADHNKYPIDDPFLYYSIIKETLNRGEQPAAPRFLYSRPGDQIVRLDWADNVETEFSGKYNVYRSQLPGGPYSFISETTESYFTDNEVANDSTYYYVITAMNTSNIETGYSNETYATPGGIDNYVYKFDFNTPGVLEGWTGNDQVGGLVQATSLNGTDGVLTSIHGINDIDPRIFYTNLLILPEDYKSWKEIEIRLRQVGSDFSTPQPFDPQGTISYFLTPDVYAPGEIKWPAFEMEYEPAGEWVTAIADISTMQKKNITLMFVDPIGNQSGTGKNFELDYVYLTGYLPEDSMTTQAPFTNIIIPGTIEFEDFDLGGVNRAYEDADYENKGNKYRAEESVDIGEKSAGEYFVGWCNAGEWLEYTVKVDDFGKYKATIHYAAETGDNELIFSVNERQNPEAIKLPETGSDKDWGTLNVEMNLSAGQKVLRFSIVAASANMKLDKIEFSLLEKILPGNGTGLHKSTWLGEVGGRNWFIDSICHEIDPEINHAWEDVGPGCDIRNDFWNIRWTGQIESLFTEDYTFYLTANDLGRLWINDLLLIDAWSAAYTGKTKAGTIAMVSGEKKNIRFDFAEKSGDAMVKLEWESQSNPREIVPKNQLYNQPLETNLPKLIAPAITVFPNPAINQLTVKCLEEQISSLTILDMFGKTVLFCHEPFNGEKTFDITGLANGLYMVVVNNKGAIFTAKFIKLLE